MHTYQWTPADTVVDLRIGPGWPWALAYLLLGLVFVSARWMKEADGEVH